MGKAICSFSERSLSVPLWNPSIPITNRVPTVLDSAHWTPGIILELYILKVNVDILSKYEINN